MTPAQSIVIKDIFLHFRERERREERKRHYVSYSHSPRHERHAQDSDASETTLLLSNGAPISKGSIDGKKKKEVEASLFLVLARTFGLDLLKSWFCKLMYDLLQFVSPQLLRSASLLYCTVACREFFPWEMQFLFSFC